MQYCQKPDNLLELQLKKKNRWKEEEAPKQEIGFKILLSQYEPTGPIYYMVEALVPNTFSKTYALKWPDYVPFCDGD